MGLLTGLPCTWDIAFKLASSRDRKGILEIKRDRKVKKLKVHYYSYYQVGNAPRNTYTSYTPCIKCWMSKPAISVSKRYGRIRWPLIFTVLKDTKGIVIDIRNYQSDFMPFAMGNYLKHEQSPFVKFTYSDFTFPGRLYWMEAEVNGTVQADHYKGRIAILINEQTISHGEYTAMALHTATGAVVIGSQTAGADGDVSEVYLPRD